MPAPAVWADFKRLPDQIGPAKQGISRNETFARWQCPYCNEIVKALAKDAQDKKGVVCGRHFWKKCEPCVKRPESDIRGRPKSAVAATDAVAVDATEAAVREQTHVIRAGNTQVASEDGTSIPVKKRTLAPPSMSEDDAPIPVKKRAPAPLSMSDDEEPIPIKKHAPTTPSMSEVIVTIYALILVATGRRVYIGQTRDPDRRLHQHASRNSKCRLVRNAFRKHGRKAFALEPILRCRKTDADANESYWIIQGNTLYPNGYNLRHGSKAGEDDDGALSTALVPACTGIVPFTGAADEARACAEAWGDVAEMVDGIEDDRNDTDELCKDLLRDIHPDKRVDGRVYTPDEVSAMLNSIRETLA